MAEHKELPGRARFRSVGRAQVVAAALLRDTFHLDALVPPLLGDYTAATVGGILVKARRFHSHEPA
jgi:hypothetical protein